MWPAQCACGQNRPLDQKNPFLDVLHDNRIRVEFYVSGRLSEIEGLAGSLVVGFCCSHLVHNISELKSIGCKIIHSPAMTYVSPQENAYAKCPPHAIHYQSQFQYNEISGQWRIWRVPNHVVIPGAFEHSMFPFSPSDRSDGFTVGRLARAARSKWSSKLFPIVEAVRKQVRETSLLAMAWNDALTQHCGEPPPWAECLEQDAISSQEFLARCHAMICCNQSDVENAPRVGLEAMSTGVPLVVDNKGGWKELCGDAAIYCDLPAEYVTALTKLATDESFRQEMIARGRKRVLEVADPDVIGAKWQSLFAKLA